MEKDDKEILFTERVNAGKRIYYIDVKRNSKGGLYIVMTESKKIAGDINDKAATLFEKHKLFLYEEDLLKFADAFRSAIQFVEENTDTSTSKTEINS